MRYLLNAIPGACIPAQGIMLDFVPIAASDVPQDVVSCIGHKDTAAIVSALVGFDVPENRQPAPPFSPDCEHFFALYRGPRLPEGATQLPDGASLDFFRVEVAP